MSLPFNMLSRLIIAFLPGRRQWHPTPVLLPGKSNGRSSLVGCSLWGCYESDMTERLHFHFSLSCSGEGNGNPLQCSCLENPRDGRAWWTAVYGVAESQTQLKQLSSSHPLERIPQDVREEVKGRWCLYSEKKDPLGSRGPQPHQGYSCCILDSRPVHQPTVTNHC